MRGRAWALVPMLAVTACSGGGPARLPAGWSRVEVTLTTDSGGPASATQTGEVATLLRPILDGNGLPTATITPHGSTVEVTSPDPALAAGLIGVPQLGVRRVAACSGSPACTGKPRPAASGPGEDDARARYDALHCPATGTPAPLSSWDAACARPTDWSAGSRFLLEPAAVTGDEVTDASAVQVPTSDGSVWTVDAGLESVGNDALAALSTATANVSGPTGLLAVELNGQVLEALPNSVPLSSPLTIAGKLAAPQAEAIAAQLRYAALLVRSQVTRR